MVSSFYTIITFSTMLAFGWSIYLTCWTILEFCHLSWILFWSFPYRIVSNIFSWNYSWVFELSQAQKYQCWNKQICWNYRNWFFNLSIQKNQHKIPKTEPHLILKKLMKNSFSFNQILDLKLISHCNRINFLMVIFVKCI